MHKRFDHAAIAKKWQATWEEDGMYNAPVRDTSKKKEYVLVELPYPSGNLHIGHWYAFAVPDIYVRMRRMQGRQVLYPMGFDAFGLPAENAAIKRGVNPREWTESNIAYMKDQLKSMGNAFTWDTTASTIDPDYYRWTQWMFTQFYQHGAAYRGEGTVNWCPSCHTVIANEQVLANDTCERCGTEIEHKRMPQWKLRITDYADALVDDLDDLDWPEHIKDAQRTWIGRSQGAEIDFTLSTSDQVTVFTTRPDTLYGATYLVLAPEHALVEKNKDTITNWDEVEAYVKAAVKKKDMDRLDDTNEKTGVRLEGITATNPASDEEIPVYVADYVLAGYGTGAIMAVPAHDERDYAFAKKFGLEVKQVVAPVYFGEGQDAPRDDVTTNPARGCIYIIIEHPTDGTFLLQREKDGDRDLVHFVGGGTDDQDDLTAVARELLEETGFSNFEFISTQPVFRTKSIGYRHSKNINQQGISGFYHVKLTDLKQAPSEIEEGRHTIEWVAKEDVEKLITWKWHTRAWSAHIHNEIHTNAGVLVHSEEFDGMDSEEAKVAITKKVGGRMTNTYRLRDWSIGRQRYWGVPIPIVYDPDGKAHIVPEEHLPWTLPEDVDCTPTGEPPLAKSAELKERTEKIFGTGWTPEVETMDTFVDSAWYFLRYIDSQNQKSLSSKEAQEDWGPVDMYFGGAEHTTMHLLYSRYWQKLLHQLGLATHNEPYLRRINRGLILGPDGNKMSKSKGNVIDPDEQVQNVGADTIKMYLAFMGPYQGSNYPWDLGGLAGIHRFLERVHGLNDHISDTEPKAVTKLLHKTIAKVTEDIEQFKFNTAISALMVFQNTAEKEGLTLESYKTYVRLLAPFAAHLSEELWHQAGSTDSVHATKWPTYDPALLIDDEVTIGVQINGKLRGDITIAPDAAESVALDTAKQNESIAQYLQAGELKKVIYIPGKILNLVVR